MGASNALRAYERYASVVPPMSMVVLTYMALVAKDADDWPWFGLGQHAIAEFAMGRPDPDDSDLRAVQRAMTPLLRSGAVTADRAPASRSDGNTTARYRLNLHTRADAEKDAWEAGTPDGKRRVLSRAERTNPSVDARRNSSGDARRFVTRRPTVCDETPDEFRPPKEEEEEEELREEEVVDLTTTSHRPRATESGDENVIPFSSPKRNRHRDQGHAELVAKGAQAREALAALNARRQARKETS